MGPALGDFRTLGKEVVEVQGHNDKRQQEAESSQESADASPYEVPGILTHFGKGALQPVSAEEVLEREVRSLCGGCITSGCPGSGVRAFLHCGGWGGEPAPASLDVG